jgi:hypothetical protein
MLLALTASRTQGLVVYDALYAWATKAKGERHDWRPSA